MERRLNCLPYVIQVRFRFTSNNGVRFSLKYLHIVKNNIYCFLEVYIYTCMTLFLILPIFPRIMDFVAPLNESRPLKPIFKGEYFIDEDKHFFLLYFHMSSTIVVIISALVTGDALFLMFNSHICGIFAAVG